MISSLSLPDLDVEAISEICGTISIVAWIVVFSPQILENFHRGSCDGLSLHFLLVWLLGDIFNVVGAILQGVLPTMIILAIYFTAADVVLLAQYFFYNGFTLEEKVLPPATYPPKAGEPNERSTLLDEAAAGVSEEPATPPTCNHLRLHLRNIVAVVLVCAAGIIVRYFVHHYAGGSRPASVQKIPEFDLWGQVFGWLCAAFYFSSRFPQLLLNWRRKSVEGLSILFFLFACLGNFMYVFSIVAFNPNNAVQDSRQSNETGNTYGKHVLVNLPWLVDALGTLLLDMAIFAQFFLYGEGKCTDSRV